MAGMTKGRLEAFSDAVIAIIITIMVLELRVPHGAELGSLRPLAPVFLSYVLSFLYLGIYWNNHHHLLHAAREVNGRILWANMLLLFWLSLLPFVTHWTGETALAAVPAAGWASPSTPSWPSSGWSRTCASSAPWPHARTSGAPGRHPGGGETTQKGLVQQP